MALAFTQARELLLFAVKLLNLPPTGALFLSVCQGILRNIVGHKILHIFPVVEVSASEGVRPPGGERNSEQFQVGATRELVQFDDLAMLLPGSYSDCVKVKAETA